MRLEERKFTHPEGCTLCMSGIAFPKLFDHERWVSAKVLNRHTDQLDTLQRYEVSTLGSVRQTATGKLLKPYWDKTRNRMVINLHSKRHNLAHVVLWSFYGLPPVGETDAAHWNDDKRDSRLTNLRWASRSSNLQDRRFNNPDRYGGVVTKFEDVDFWIWDTHTGRERWNFNP